ncbi:MAG: response regulator transcription factor [Gammaproteobacteria bacterium]|nr:response regulator transcription factor [Gammaproteobacteria bacterium]
MRILVIEDDLTVSQYILSGLQSSGHNVTIANEGLKGLSVATKEKFDAMVVDRMLPGMDGLTLIETIRKAGNSTPVLILSALSDVDDKVQGLKAGGDDYLTKPFAFLELLARIEALVRRSSIQEDTTSLQDDDLYIDLISRKVLRQDLEVKLKPREFQLLEYMMRNKGQIVTRAMLLQAVWNYHFDPQTNVIDVHISRLRQKIDKDFSVSLIHTVRGVGYVLGSSE